MLGHERRIEIKNRIQWLRETLIPDLQESGKDATAEDFEFCCDAIEQLLPRQEKAVDRDQAIQMLIGSGADTAMALSEFFEIDDDDIAKAVEEAEAPYKKLDDGYKEDVAAAEREGYKWS